MKNKLMLTSKPSGEVKLERDINILNQQRLHVIIIHLGYTFFFVFRTFKDKSFIEVMHDLVTQQEMTVKYVCRMTIDFSGISIFSLKKEGKS